MKNSHAIQNVNIPCCSILKLTFCTTIDSLHHNLKCKLTISKWKLCLERCLHVELWVYSWMIRSISINTDWIMRLKIDAVSSSSIIPLTNLRNSFDDVWPAFWIGTSSNYWRKKWFKLLTLTAEYPYSELHENSLNFWFCWRKLSSNLFQHFWVS